MRRLMGLTGLLMLAAVSIASAATPLDGFFTGLVTSLPLWGAALIGFGGIILALIALLLISHGAGALMYVVLGFAVLVVIGMASSGKLAAWAMAMF